MKPVRYSALHLGQNMKDAGRVYTPNIAKVPICRETEKVRSSSTWTYSVVSSFFTNEHRLPALEHTGYTLPMIPLPKPRGFWDYALFALIMTGLLMFLFWSEASDAVGWTDAALAFAAAVLLVFAIILARRAERATWIAQPARYANLLAVLGACGLMFGATYADAYLLHRRDITSSRLRHDMALFVGLTAFLLWSIRRRPPARRQLL
jgi:hypothetical protein